MKLQDWQKIFAIIFDHKGDESPITAAEHDQVYFNLTTDDVPEDSDDGKLLDKLGCFVESDSWAKWV